MVSVNLSTVSLGHFAPLFASVDFEFLETWMIDVGHAMVVQSMFGGYAIKYVLLICLGACIHARTHAYIQAERQTNRSTGMGAIHRTIYVHRWFRVIIAECR